MILHLVSQDCRDHNKNILHSWGVFLSRSDQYDSIFEMTVNSFLSQWMPWPIYLTTTVLTGEQCLPGRNEIWRGSCKAVGVILSGDVSRTGSASCSQMFTWSSHSMNGGSGESHPCKHREYPWHFFCSVWHSLFWKKIILVFILRINIYMTFFWIRKQHERNHSVWYPRKVRRSCWLICGSMNYWLSRIKSK